MIDEEWILNKRTGLFEPEDKSVTIVIIVITSLVFFIMELWEKSQTSGYFLKNTTEFLLEHGALYAPKLLEGEWYRVITYLFLHSGIEHLMNNMLVLYFLGNALEHYMKKFAYVFIYFFSGIVAAMGSVLYNTQYPVCVGASGAVFGIIGAMVWIVLKNRGSLQGISKRRMLFFVFLSVYSGFTTQGIDNAAHIAGLLAGFLLSILMTKIEKVSEIA